MTDQSDKSCETGKRQKLGLALAGGGFRASLFHLGTLRRMAELDILRYVEVLSTVSGGSITGALYILILKHYIDRHGSLTREQYIEVVDRTEAFLLKGIRKNLRTRLLMNPFRVLSVLVTHRTLAEKMALMYERHIYREAVETLRKDMGTDMKASAGPGWFRLNDIQVRPAGLAAAGGFESYNRKAVTNHGSVITHLVLNATSLNSGTPFWLSANEIGDRRLGFIRHDEIEKVLIRKKILQDMSAADLEKSAAMRSVSVKFRDEYFDVEPRVLSLADWWRKHREGRTRDMRSDEWADLFRIDSFPGRLPDADFGELRFLKLCAWYIRKGSTLPDPVCGGLTNDQHLERLWNEFRQIDGRVCERVRKAADADRGITGLLLDFMIEFYYLRSAEVISDRIRQNYDSLSIGNAVGASACFPPVFPPLILLGVYDDLHVARLGLTDGGVYDNVGITALLEERCNYIIASDTSGLFDMQQQSSSGRIGMMTRIVNILMDDVAALQRRRLQDKRRVSKRIDLAGQSHSAFRELKDCCGLDGLAFFHISSPPVGGSGIKTGPDPKLVASLRTDLDGFGDIEIAALVNRGYDAADRYIRHYLSDSPYRNAGNGHHWKNPAAPPMELPADSARVRKILDAGKSRFFRALKLRAPLTMFVASLSLICFLALIPRLWDVTFSVKGIVAWASEKAIRWMESSLPVIGRGWTSWEVPLGAAMLALSLVGLIIWLVPVALRKAPMRLLRRYATAVKWARSLSLNGLWVLWAMPLFIAFSVSVYAWISHLFFYLPFERVTRIEK